MNYRSVNDMNRLTSRWAGRVAERFDVIVGVPRSGLLAANLLALHANLPLTDVHGLLAGKLIAAGARLAVSPDRFLATPRRVLVLDDSIRTGRQLHQTREELRPVADRHDLTFAAVYATTSARPRVDLTLDTCDDPRVFEWNLMHHSMLQSACVDIDGVLCHDPTDAENDDGPGYERFLLHAAPRHLPSRPIGRLVTSRLARYRRPTEQWLADHHVEYGELIMLDLPDAATRRRLGLHAQFKGAIYRECDARLFIESATRQAMTIADTATKPVICTEDGVLYEPGMGSRLRGAGRRVTRAGLRRAGLIDTRLGRWLGRFAAASGSSAPWPQNRPRRADAA